MDNKIDLGSLGSMGVDMTTVMTRSHRLPRHKQGEKFLKGPIPLNWLIQASLLGGKALHLGIVIWLLAGMKRDREVKLAGWALQAFGVGRKALYRALHDLEEAGLISVDRQPGRRAVVELLAVGEAATRLHGTTSDSNAAPDNFPEG